VLSLLDPTAPRADLIAVLRWLAESPALSAGREAGPPAPAPRSNGRNKRQPEFTMRLGRHP
jgi:hypothetical protein